MSMPKHFLKGFAVADQVREIVSPGISVHALGTFPLELINLEFHYDPICAELGLPDSSLLYKITLDAPLGWQGYTFELVGTVAEPTDLTDAPRFTDLLYQENPLTIIAWRRRVAYQAAHGWIEVRWHPTQGETVTVHRGASTLPFMEAPAVDQALYRGYKLLINGVSLLETELSNR